MLSEGRAGDPHGGVTSTSFRSQIRSEFRYPGKSDLYIALGERWFPAYPSRSRISGSGSGGSSPVSRTTA